MKSMFYKLTYMRYEKFYCSKCFHDLLNRFVQVCTGMVTFFIEERFSNLTHVIDVL